MNVWNLGASPPMSAPSSRIRCAGHGIGVEQIAFGTVRERLALWCRLAEQTLGVGAALGRDARRHLLLQEVAEVRAVGQRRALERDA